MPLITLFVTVANFVGAQMIKRETLHPKLQIALGGVIGVVGIYIGSF